MEGDDVCVRLEGLVDSDFSELGAEGCVVEVGLGEDLECKIPAIDDGRT